MENGSSSVGDLVREVFHDGDEHRMISIRLPESAGVRQLFDLFCLLFVEGSLALGGGGGLRALQRVGRKMRQVGVRCDVAAAPGAAAPLPPHSFRTRFGGDLSSSALLVPGGFEVRFTPEINTGPPGAAQACGRS